MTDILDDGLYFDLPADIYHAQPRLGSGNIADLLISPPTFWARSWLNPDKEQDDDDTPARKLGRAYHDALFLPAEFETQYVRLPSKEEFGDDLVRNGTEIGDLLAEYGAPKTQKGEDVIAKAQRLASLGCLRPVWPLIEAEHKQMEEDGKTLIDGAYYDQLLKDVTLLRKDPDIAPRFTGGQPEVSIFWTDENGTPKKARLDYLKADSWTDKKTFDNPMRKRLEQLILDIFRYNNYYLQAAHYHEGVEKIRDGSLAVSQGLDECKALAEQIRKQKKPLEIHYVFQQKKGIPAVLSRQVKVFTTPPSHEHAQAGASEEAIERAANATRRKSLFFMKAETEIWHACSVFRYCMETFGERQPWPALNKIGTISDDDFPPFWLEN
jgi:hypothetical protein